ncbi:MAG: PPC domain-containing DNA-binding protein [Chloroflexota bacterium]
MQAMTVRLKPGQDLFDQIERLVAERAIEAGCVLCAVGSLTHATLRLANRDFHSEYDGPFEIVSMTGTVSVHGSHLHISISDGDGQTIGGHLAPGCRVYTTVELALGIFEEVVYTREMCEQSGYEELAVRPRGSSSAAS